jgi:hypothetical protein
MSGSRSPDPFTGVWNFSAQQSTLSAPHPRSWIQRIKVTASEVSVREEIIGADGTRTVVTLQAKFDGKEYPVSGSPAADTMAYDRTDIHNVSATAKKNGTVSMREALTVSLDGRFLTQIYSIYRGPREVANGTAVFENTQN